MHSCRPNTHVTTKAVPVNHHKTKPDPPVQIPLQEISEAEAEQPVTGKRELIF
jgi:hypothetical protein